MNFALCPLTSFEGIIGTISRADSFFSVCLIMGLWMNLNELANKCGPSRMVVEQRSFWELLNSLCLSFFT